MSETNPAIKITDRDGWRYEIIAYEEETVIEYYEEVNGEFIKKSEDVYASYDNFDEKIANAILRVRKTYKELNSGPF